MSIDDPTTARPSDIDEELARLDIEHAKAQDTLNRLTARVKSLVNDGMTAYAADLEPRIEQARQTIAECEAAARPLDAEFKRRGGWNRAWLVLNTGGHVHRTTACRTCFPSTQFGWLTHLSGQDEAEPATAPGFRWSARSTGRCLPTCSASPAPPLAPGIERTAATAPATSPAAFAKDKARLAPSN
jgi:hypothetical protein